MSVRVWLLKHYRDEAGELIPRGRFIDVSEEQAGFLEGCDPKRAVRADKTAEIKAYEKRVENVIAADRTKRAAKKK
jgi:hypothetical protein